MKSKLKLFRIDGGPFTKAALSIEHARTLWEARNKEAREDPIYVTGFQYDTTNIIEQPTPFKAEREIYDDQTFSEYCCEYLEGFCTELIQDRRYARPVDPNAPHDDDIEGAEFMYTRKGQLLVERLISWFYHIGTHHWPDGDICIESHMYRED